VDNVHLLPVPMAAPSKTRTVFDRSKTGIVGSNPARGMTVYVFCVVLSCVGIGFASDWSPVQGDLPNVKNRFLNFRS